MDARFPLVKMCVVSEQALSPVKRDKQDYKGLLKKKFACIEDEALRVSSRRRVCLLVVHRRVH